MATNASTINAIAAAGPDRHVALTSGVIRVKQTAWEIATESGSTRAIRSPTRTIAARMTSITVRMWMFFFCSDPEHCVNECSGYWVPKTPETECIAAWQSCLNAERDCCGDLACKGNEWSKQCE